MIKFDINKTKKILLKVNKENDIKNNELGINLILSNMILFNSTIDEVIEKNDNNKKYFLYNLNSTIFKQLNSFKIYPINVKRKNEIKENDENYIFNVIKNKVEKI